MTSTIFQFGHKLPEFEVRVLNERAVRAGAGILFFFAMVSFMNAWLLGNFQPTRVFVVAFLVDFTTRLFVNPTYAPSLILGQWLVRNQQPEYVGAPQKRFAWAIGFGLALAMWYLMVLNHVVGPVNLMVCAICLTLMLFESAFGICVGCKIYNLFNKEQARLCPGGACELPADKRTRLSPAQWVSLVAFAGVLVITVQWIYGGTPGGQGVTPVMQPGADLKGQAEAQRCKVPDFAKAMGHEDKWKLHNNCR